MSAAGRWCRELTAVFLRGLPDIPGRFAAAGVVHRRFPVKQDEARVIAPMRLGYRMVVDLRSALTEWPAYYMGDYDTAAIKALRKVIGHDWTVLDVGANVGFWTVPLAQQARKGGRVHAFEPMPGNLRRLRENLRLNGLDDAVTTYDIGLSDEAARVQLSLREDFAQGAETGNAAIVIDETDARFRTVEIEVARLDDVGERLGIERVDFVKVDIEGHEDRFLLGARQTIAKWRPIIYTEISEPYYLRRKVDITQFLNEWMRAYQYTSVLWSDHRWSEQPVSKRRAVLDDVLLVPAERTRAVLERLRD